MSNENQSKIIKLIEHARKITSDMMRFAFELTEETRESAEKSLEYGKKVRESVQKLIYQDLSGSIGNQDIYTVVFVSVLPQIDNAITELTSALQRKSTPKMEEYIPTEEELEKMLMENYERVMDEEKGDLKMPF